MKKIIKMRNVIAILALTMMTSACNRDTGYFCFTEDIDDGICKKGDIIWDVEEDQIIDICDFNSTIYKMKFFSQCKYIGEKRKLR